LGNPNTSGDKTQSLRDTSRHVDSPDAGTDNGKGNDSQNNGNQNGRDQATVRVVPEANAGWVLVPFFGAVLFFFSTTSLPCEGDPTRGIKWRPTGSPFPSLT
jgi:hypothetical protein